MRKKKEEDTAVWDEYMEQRKQARIKEEEDLKKLKERQVSCGVLVVVDVLLTRRRVS